MNEFKRIFEKLVQLKVTEEKNACAMLEWSEEDYDVAVACLRYLNSYIEENVTTRFGMEKIAEKLLDTLEIIVNEA